MDRQKVIMEAFHDELSKIAQYGSYNEYMSANYPQQGGGGGGKLLPLAAGAGAGVLGYKYLARRGAAKAPSLWSRVAKYGGRFGKGLGALGALAGIGGALASRLAKPGSIRAMRGFVKDPGMRRTIESGIGRASRMWSQAGRQASRFGSQASGLRTTGQFFKKPLRTAGRFSGTIVGMPY